MLFSITVDSSSAFYPSRHISIGAALQWFFHISKLLDLLKTESYLFPEDTEAGLIYCHQIALHMRDCWNIIHPATADCGSHHFHLALEPICESFCPMHPPLDIGWQKGPAHRGVQPDDVLVFTAEDNDSLYTFCVLTS